MKTVIRYILVIAIILGLSSCSEWLKVTPEGLMEQDEMFSNEAGFEDALNGIYIEMKNDKAYGQNLSYGAIEYLVSSWTVEAQSTAEYLGTFNYGDAKVETLIESIFQQQYHIIAQVNNILSVIDERQSVFVTPGLYEQIKGECIGLRAYVHFDILRLFGPVPGTETTELILPYVTKISKENKPYSNYADYKSALENDIAEAKELLGVAKEYGNYQDYVSIRMNDEAVLALEARSKLWYGENQEAFEIAQSIIELTSCKLGNTDSFQAGNFVLLSEHIVGLHVYNMNTKYDSRFKGEVYFKGSDSQVVKTNLYGNTGTDIREISLWETFIMKSGESRYSIKKYQSGSSDTQFNYDYKRIPLLRLSEIYFIAIETASDRELAQQYWTDFLKSRNVESRVLPTDVQAMKMELAKEYRREFFAEGQAFYAYKRLNVTAENFLWLPAGATINYVFPLPVNEVVIAE